MIRRVIAFFRLVPHGLAPRRGGLLFVGSQQTGFDSAKSQPSAAPPTTATGTAPGAGARGAARGAIVGGIAGDAGAGAAAGAVAARGQSRRQNRAAGEQAQAANQQQQVAFANARAVCLEGRGYTVK